MTDLNWILGFVLAYSALFVSSLALFFHQDQAPQQERKNSKIKFR